MKKFNVITVTHKSVNLNNLGKFIMPAGNDPVLLKDQLHKLKAKFGFDELLYLLTCNRVTYFFTSDVHPDEEFRGRFFHYINPRLNEKDLFKINEISDLFEGDEAIRHLKETASSLDSLVIGEREILRQLKDAYNQCNEMGLTGDDIRIAIKYVIQTAKKVYTQTRIGEKPISVVSLAVRRLVNENLPKNSRFIVIGAGQTIDLTLKFLQKYKYHNIVVFNRTLEKAEKLAVQYNVKALPLSELAAYDKGFDILVTCTGAIRPMITGPLFESLLIGDKSKKTILDLAIPSDTDEEVLNRFDVNYIDIEELRAEAEKNLEFRRHELVLAKQFIDDQLEEFKMAFHQREIERSMCDIPVKIKAIRKKAYTQVFAKEINDMDSNSRDILDRVVGYLEKKYISIPMAAARKVVEEG